MNFNYYVPVNIRFGRGRVTELPEHVKTYGSKALIVTGRNSTKKTGLLDRIEALLEAAGIVYTVFDQVEPNPLSTTAHKGADLAAANGCDVVIAVGGGSIMDCAKNIAFLCCNREGDIFDYIWGKRTGSKALPLIAVPTTCGTGSDGDGIAVLTNPETNDKKSLNGPYLIPKVSILDPELYMTMPKSIFSAVVFDALCHCVESYVTQKATPLSEMYSLKGVELIGKYFVRVYNNYETDEEGWDALVLASILGGMALQAAGGGAPHALEHPASGLRNVTHGLGLAAVSPYIYELQVPCAKEKFDVLSPLLGGTGADDFVAAWRKLIQDVDIDFSLSDLGVKEEDIEWMTENCLSIMKAIIDTSPYPMTKEEVREVYRKAF
ncbi:iron-containing alcohol dehydrogenase [Anaerolentibacter hominis]|uniref:iron-containing alcohol dehydrogenase n=1 Tax=Anaerolentibacter hominis TaxID=3079009 RepID=UPI0031B87C4C